MCFLKPRRCKTGQTLHCLLWDQKKQKQNMLSIIKAVTGFVKSLMWTDWDEANSFSDNDLPESFVVEASQVFLGCGYVWLCNLSWEMKLEVRATPTTGLSWAILLGSQDCCGAACNASTLGDFHGTHAKTRLPGTQVATTYQQGFSSWWCRTF